MAERIWSTVEYLQQGGWVMVPLLATSLVMWGLIIDKYRAFARYQGADIAITDAAALLVYGTPHPNGHGHGLRRYLLEDFLAVRAGVTAVDRALLSCLTDQRRRDLSSRLPVITVLAAVAPLLGLLGTVLGMIQTFEVISVFGTSNAKAMAGGISVALITTQAGLMVAIPGLLLNGALWRKARSLACTLDEFSVALDRLLREGAGETRKVTVP